MSEKIEIIKLDDVTPYLDKIDRKDAEPGLLEEVSENGDEVFFIRVSDTIVGTTYISDEARAFVYVYIFPEYRNRGYGESAVSAAEQMIRTTPLLRILTAYNDQSEAAKRLAEKHGYAKKYSSALMEYRGERFEEPELPVRKYRDEDFDEAASLSAEAFHVMRLSTGCFPDSVVAQATEEDRKYCAENAENEYVIELNGEIVGYAAIDGTELEEVSIRIPHQGKGLGRKFVTYLTNRILEKGEGEPVLWCVVGNDKARALYDSLGYEEVCRNDFAEKKFGV
ncbi:MAG: GNAT family N-acetyltransferase [Clostridia bacterium]|nr:GNAT family N-acetyltransferase [Clostridia bacterium]